MASIEEKVEEHYKKILDELGIRHYGKTESINRTITDALRSADSKSGGSGNNYPDIQLLLENKTARRIPVMIEAKGLKNRLEKISKSGQIELITYYEKDSKRKDGTIQHHAGDANYSSIMNYAVNGAVHYANAILDSRGYTEVIAIGINGTQMNADGSVQDAECRAYYISEKNMDSFVWDRAMGSAGFLVSAMDIMIKDAQAKIHDQKELEKKITNIKEHQLLGVEILGNIYILAVLNMILMGDGSSNIYNGDGHDYNNETGKFPATVFLLNPPYSADGKGFNFVQEALEKMTSGYACILIQENAGSGNGLPYTKKILEKNTLCASVHMSDIFCGKSSVQTAIYVFQVARPHEVDDMVIFIDFSNDGYARQNRKKSSQEVNLRDADHAAERYAEVEAIVLGKKPRTQYYTEENGLVIRDTVSLNGNDWTFAQHKVIDTMPTEEDFRKTVADYLAWKVSQAIKGDGGYGV